MERSLNAKLNNDEFFKDLALYEAYALYGAFLTCNYQHLE